MGEAPADECAAKKASSGSSALQPVVEPRREARQHWRASRQRDRGHRYVTEAKPVLLLTHRSASLRFNHLAETLAGQKSRWRGCMTGGAAMAANGERMSHTPRRSQDDTPCKWVSRLFCCTHTAYCIRFEVYVVHPQAALETLIHLTYPPPPPSPLPRILLKAPLRLM
ncbi:hypothetical protein PF002_g7227 [Phytophthora fragariae]|uniref:Uncharacterized protein n=1 Tax=Phytophthora fragariae TaxID=53985 RepID=A0A6A3ZVX8_9STRA|nr:hypothetical protein PF002_g7227 [Phytophthora fragariae]